MDTETIWESVGQNSKTGFLANSGRMGQAILEYDWANTSIGPIGNWPQSLKSVVQMAMLTRQAICLFWGKDLNIIYNDAYAPILGEKEANALGRPAQEVWSDVWEHIAPIIREALSGKGTWGENFPLTMTRNGFEEQTYWTFSYSPLYADDGTIGGMINITTDTSSAVENKTLLEKSVGDVKSQVQNHRVIQREMAHRIKNILTMTLAVVSQTMRHAESLEDAADTITKRITALSNAQDVLTDAHLDEADVGTLIAEILRPHLSDGQRIRLTGPDITIPAAAALGMALAIHELATNAIKYGALSNEVGLVRLDWSSEKDGSFKMSWVETGGPPVTPPTRPGFGSRLMKRIVPSYFQGTGESFYDPSGFRYILSGTILVEEDRDQPTR